MGNWWCGRSVVATGMTDLQVTSDGHLWRGQQGLVEVIMADA